MHLLYSSLLFFPLTLTSPYALLPPLLLPFPSPLLLQFREDILYCKWIQPLQHLQQLWFLHWFLQHSWDQFLCQCYNTTPSSLLRITTCHWERDLLHLPGRFVMNTSILISMAMICKVESNDRVKFSLISRVLHHCMTFEAMLQCCQRSWIHCLAWGDQKKSE